MSDREHNLSTAALNPESNQPLGDYFSKSLADRPMDAAVHPAGGTIEAPVVVVGATGTIGSAVVRLLVAAEQAVVAIAERIESDEEAARLARRLRELERPIAGVVVTFPHDRSATVGAERGRLLDQSTDDLRDCLHRTVLTQHALARHLIPVLAASGRNTHYVIVGGPGSEAPWAGYGHRSVAMAATRMLARVLHDEARPSGVRVQLLSIDSPVRSDALGAHECPEWPAASDVAQRIVDLVDRRNTCPSDEAVITCTRGKVARALGGVARAFDDVPTFLASLRNPNRRITPQ